MSAKDDAVNSNKVDLTQSGGYQTEEDRTRRLLRLEIDSETFGEPGNPTFGEITLPGFLDEGGGTTPPPVNVLPPPSSTVATGGDSVFDEFIDGILWRYHAFTSVGSSSFDSTENLVVDIFCVGGGGGGGGLTLSTSGVCGSGGGGGVVYLPATYVPAGTYVTMVGGGGAGGVGESPGNTGGTSIFHTVTATGGGGGGAKFASLADGNGKDGASGGSAGGHSNPNFRYGGGAIFGQGNRGADNFFLDPSSVLISSANGTGGGGGAGAPGEEVVYVPSISSYRAGNGGIGVGFTQFYMYGESGWYGGGAGGSINGSAWTGTVGSGGLGGGADGVQATNATSATQRVAGIKGIDTSGGGGSGSASRGSFATGNRLGGDGGSGIVIVRYQLAT